MKKKFASENNYLFCNLRQQNNSRETFFKMFKVVFVLMKNNNYLNYDLKIIF